MRDGRVVKVVSTIQFAEVKGDGDEACDSFNAFR